IYSRFEIRFRFSSLIDSFVARTNTGYRSPFVKHLRARELREDIHASFFALFTQPAHEFVERHDIIAVISERRRKDRHWNLALRRKEIDMLFADWGFKRRAFVLKIGHQFTQADRIKHCSG